MFLTFCSPLFFLISFFFPLYIFFFVFFLKQKEENQETNSLIKMALIVTTAPCLSYAYRIRHIYAVKIIFDGKKSRVRAGTMGDEHVPCLTCFQ